MSSDGAHLGVKAVRALDTILGGEPSPSDNEQMTVEQMRDWLLSAPPCTEQPADYDECARMVAGEILRWALANPERYAHTPMENEYERDADGNVDWSNPVVTRRSLYDVLKDEGVQIDRLGITGFQWGWAYNAARRCLELPPEQNPAILTVGQEWAPEKRTSE